MDFTVEDVGTDQKKEKPILKRRHKTVNNKQAKKPKNDIPSPEQKSTKISKAELFKPPTVEELNQLRETEILFNSNLFRLQTEELLKEIAIKEKRVKLITAWIEKFQQSFENIADNIEMKLSDANTVFGQESNGKIKNKIQEIVTNKPFTLKTDQDSTLQFVKPKSIDVMGLYSINAICKPVINVHLNIVIPKSYFHARDYMNSRYLVKRSLYLSYITSYLKQKSELYTEMCFNYLNGNILIPVLQIKTDIKETIFNIRVIPEENTFKSAKFQPEKKNLRCTYINSLFNDVFEEEFSTPFYNSVILNDLSIEQNDKFRASVVSNLKGVCHGIVLLKVWLDQRGFLTGFGGFNEDLLYSFITYLVHKGKINKHMSSYQVIRNAWTYLASSTWDTNGISLSDSPYDLEIFHKHYDVVFVDRTGNYNLASDLNLNIYLKIKNEAKLAITYLDDGKFNSFQSLFITKMPYYLQYDAVINIPYDTKLEEIYNTAEIEKKSDYFSFKYPVIIRKILNYLKEGLSDRIDFLTPLINSNTSWAIDGPVNKCEESITIGLNLNHFNLYKVVEKGPPTYDDAAAGFREFWGNRAELRRFKDGSITEAVYWAADTLQEKRKIFKDIVIFVLETKLNLNFFNVISDQFDSVLKMNPYTGIEEGNMKIINVFDELSKLLRGLKLPLDITAVQGISDAFSYSDAFPPTQANYMGGKKITFLTESNILLKENHTFGMVPKYVSPIEGIIQMAQHSKWPNDYKALCNLKTAFYIEISKQLKKDHNIKSNPKPEFLDILYRGLIFRLSLFHSKQIIELKKIVDEKGVTSYEDNDASIKQEQKFIMLPRLMGALNGIHAQYPSFGPSTALIKRWINTQLIDEEHIPNIIIALLNASLYLNSAPFSQSALPQVAFFRFLHMLANYDWTLQPVILNFNNEITREQLNEHESFFHRNRSQFSPLHIITPYDNFKSVLTKYVPSQVILNRLKVLGTECITLIEKDIDSQSLLDTSIFMKPNLNGYNVLIHLRPLLNPRRHQAIDFVNSENKANIKPYKQNNQDKIPVVDFNPVNLYLTDLRDNYDDYALFFHDSYGGNVIAVLWKPMVHQEEEFKIAQIAGRNLIKDNKTKVNIDAIIEDFYILGDGLVKTIEVK